MEPVHDGEVVVFYDPTGKPHSALVTNAWGGTTDGCVNLAYVTSDQSERDPYGLQLKRESSVTHASKTNVFGRYWRCVDEAARPMSVS